MSWFFYPYLRRYWLEETKEKLTAVLCLKQKVTKDIVQQIMRYLQKDDDPDPINWLKIWYQNPAVHRTNPLICFEGVNSYGLICLFGLITYETLLHASNDKFKNKPKNKPKNKNEEPNIDWLSKEITTKNFDSCRLHLAHVIKYELNEYNKQYQYFRYMQSSDIFLGIIISDNDTNDDFQMQITDMYLPFDKYIEIDIRRVDDVDISNVKLLEIEKRKLWYTKLNPIMSFHFYPSIICSKKETSIHVVYGFTNPEPREKLLNKIHDNLDYQQYLREILSR